MSYQWLNKEHLCNLPATELRDYANGSVIECSCGQKWEYSDIYRHSGDLVWQPLSERYWNQETKKSLTYYERNTLLLKDFVSNTPQKTKWKLFIEKLGK